MSETGAIIAEMTDRLFFEQFDDAMARQARAGVWPEDSWRLVADHALPLALVCGQQGFDVPLRDGLAIVRALGRHVIPLPLAETMMANALLADLGLPVTTEPAALITEGSGVSLEERNGSWHAIGTADRVAWGCNAQVLLIEDRGRIALMTSGFRTIERGSNLAQMPRDRLSVDGPVTVAPTPQISLLEAGALMRALAMVGAMETVTEMTVAYVSDRVQFGRPLSKFQAVQHLLARLASEAAAASVAADLAAEAFAESSPQTSVAIAAARSRISEAAGTAIGIAHQLHGAIGFTEEHRLQRYTTAIWSWRDEFGSAASWTRKLGVEALAKTKSAFWPFITSV